MGMLCFGWVNVFASGMDWSASFNISDLGVIKLSHDALGRLLTGLGLFLQRESRRNAPKSPTMTQITAKRKAIAKSKGKRYVRRLKSRKAGSHSRAKPGGLKDSISFGVNVGRGEVRIFVPSNSTAGKYAVRMHDERGVSWRYLGIGNKGFPRQREKFIKRAVEDNIDFLMDKVSRAINL